MSKSARALTIFAVLALLSTPSLILACPYCAYSPDGWGFCRYYAQVGYLECHDKVVDPFSGRTDCDLTGVNGSCRWPNEYPPGGGSTGGGSFGSDCEYHDALGNCMTDSPDTYYGY